MDQRWTLLTKSPTLDGATTTGLQSETPPDTRRDDRRSDGGDAEDVD